MKKNTYKNYLSFLLLLIFSLPGTMLAQLTGTKSIPGDYATIQAAIIDLNSQSVGTGGVTFNIAAGHQETLASETAGTITATGTSSNPIIFQKSGTGNNPQIIAYQWTIATAYDGMIKITGGDYITFDRIDLAENSLNTTIYTDWGYALVKGSATAPFDGCQFVTIRSCNIDLNRANVNSVGIYSGNHIATSTTSLTITDPNDAMNNGKFFSNVIIGAYTGIRLAGFAATTPFALYDQNNEIGVDGQNVIANYGGGSSTAYGTYAIYQNNLKVANNSITSGSGTTTTLYGIFNSTGTSSNVDIYNNTITIEGGGTTSSIYGISNSMGSTAAGNTVNIYGNTVQNCTYPTATTGVLYSIYNTASAATVNMYQNTVTGNTIPGTGSFYGVYSGACTNLNMYENTVSNNQKTGASTTMYCTYASTAIVNYYQNNIFNNAIPNSSGTTSATIYGYYNLGSPSIENLHDNNIYNNTVGGTSTATGSFNDGMYTYTVTTAVKNIYNNNIYGLTAQSGNVNGIRTNLGTVNIYQNDIYNLINYTTSTTVAATNGITIIAGTAIYAYNNFISDLRTVLSASLDAIRGINITSTTASSTIGLYYNSIYLHTISGGVDFGSSGIFHTSNATATTAALDMRNNVIVNSSTPIGTGLTVAYRRSGIDLANYSSISNNNLFYAGTPSASNLIFYDGTNADQTIGDYKSRVTPRDGSSFSENPPFVNTVSLPYDIHMLNNIATQTESGGTPVSTPIAIVNDFDGDTRNAVTPDVGGDEFSGIGMDMTPPSISYIPLIPTSSLTQRTLTASITDASGVPTAGIGLPVLYWRINSGTWNSATAVFVSGSNYDFTYGGGVILGDTVKYYIVAQDNATTPNVGSFPSGGAGGFTANPPTAATPPTIPSSYLIVDLPLSGSYTVGTTLFNSISGRDITFVKSVHKVLKEVVIETDTHELTREKGIEHSELTEVSHSVNGIRQMVEVEEVIWTPMENGQIYKGDLFIKKTENPSLNFPDGIDGVYLTITAALSDLNLRGVSGATTFLLTDATYPTETFPLVVDVLNENKPTSVNTVTIRPNTGVTVTVSGASPASQIFKIFNSYVTLDGSNSGGTTRDWTIENISTTTPQVILVGSRATTPITNVTVKNCNIINGIISSSAVVVSDGNAPGTAGWFNNITIQNNSIRKAYIGVYNISVIAPGNGNGLLLTGNDLNNTTPDHIALIGLYVQGVDGATVSNNNIGNYSTTYTSNVTGIWFATGTINSTITDNTIGPINITTAAPRGIVVTSGLTNANVTIAGNTVTGMITSYSSAPYGIWVFSTTTGVNIEKNIVSNISNTNAGGYGARGIHINTGLASSNISISNNVVSNISATADASTTYWGIGIGIEGATMGVNVYYNSVNLYGTLSGYSAGTIHAAFAVITSTASLLDVRDNIFVNSFDNTNSATDKSYAIYSAAPNAAFSVINYNDYYVSGVPGILGYLGSDITTLPAWQTATGQDVNSLSADPQFTAPDDLRPAMTSPVIAAGTPIAGITTDFLGVTRSATNPSMGAYEQGVVTPLSGTYTVGLSAFLQATGKKIYFETRTRTVTKDLLAEDTNIDLLANDEKENGGQPPILEESQRYVTVTEEYLEMMENGKPFDYSFFKSDASRGVYPTITSAVTDLILRGVSGPVTFQLVDSNYPTETYPIDLVSYAGASATNTVTFKPATGIQAVIPGSTTQTTGTIRINTDGQYYIIDGSNTVGGTTRDLTITNGATGALPTIHFFSNGSNNVVKNCILESQSTSTGTGTVILAAGTASNNNTIENNLFRPVTSLVNASGVYLFSTTLSSSNTITGNEFVNFTSRAITLQGAAGVNGNGAVDNLIYHDAPSTLTTVYGIYLGRGKNNVIENNVIKNLHSSAASPTLIGIYYIGASGDTMNIRIFNNVVSISSEINQTAGTIRGIDYFGYAANSAEIYYNTVFVGGSNVTGGTTTAFAKRDDALNLTVKDNTFNNARSNISGTGVHYAVQFSDTVTTVRDLNYNHYYASGTGAVFGIFGTVAAPSLAAWQALTLQDANSISADPIFVSSMDYRPQTVSPLLDAGLTIAGITTDILGDLRGTPPTIGAYENGVFVALSAPSNLSAMPDTFTVDLGWQDNSNNEFGFVIQMKLGDSTSVNPWVNIDTVNANVINYLDMGLNPNTLYSYRLFGYNSLGNSGFSNIVEVTTFIPVELTTFTAEVSGREILVSWITATELNNRGFDIERKMDGEWEKISFKDGKGTTTEESYYSFLDKFTYDSYVGTIVYRLKQMDFDGTYAYSPEVEVDVDLTPKEYTLYQNYPNPFNPVTTIKYSLPFESNVRIVVYNILGEMLDILVDETKQVGFHDYNWNASNLASGIYIYTIEAKSLAGENNFSSVKKMILMK